MSNQPTKSQPNPIIAYIIQNDDRKSSRLEVPDIAFSKTLKQPSYDGARCLISLGFDPSTVIHIYRRLRDGTTMLVWKPTTLAELAQWIVVERDWGGLSKEKYQPHPRAHAA
jgi:hypothetical protein